MEVRALIERVDWDCEVLTNYSDHNLGCGRRPATGLDWIFENVEEAIILEDDCLPNQSFFRFCEELLDRYRADEQVMMISGDNFLFGKHGTPDSYFFSRFVHVWGWATWRRAWQHYDYDIQRWPELRTTDWLLNLFGDQAAAEYWREILDAAFSTNDQTTWDYQWAFTCWLKDGVSITPNVNLVSNIGFGREATHTKLGSRLKAVPAKEMLFPLLHPPERSVHREADVYFFNQVLVRLWQRNLPQRLGDKLGIILSRYNSRSQNE
jgi:hypothetical protein